MVYEQRLQESDVATHCGVCTLGRKQNPRREVDRTVKTGAEELRGKAIGLRIGNVKEGFVHLGASRDQLAALFCESGVFRPGPSSH